MGYSIYGSGNRRALRIFISVAIVVLFVGIGLGVYFYKSNHRNETDIVRTKRLISRHVILPSEEEPVLATITDKNKLESDFLKKGEDGDRVLIYSKAKKVIIYRPSVDKVVEIGPVSILPLNEGPKQ